MSIAPTKTKPLLTKTLSPQVQELIRIAKDKIKISNAADGRAREAIRDVYYHLTEEDNFAPLEARDICREEFREFSDRTLRRALPEVAKHQNMVRSNTKENGNEIVDTVHKSQPEIPISEEYSNKIEQLKEDKIWLERELERERDRIEKLRSGTAIEQLENKCYKLETENHTLGEDLRKVTKERDELQKINQKQSYRISDLEKGLKYSRPNQQDLDELRDKVSRLERENKVNVVLGSSKDGT